MNIITKSNTRRTPNATTTTTSSSRTTTGANGTTAASAISTNDNDGWLSTRKRGRDDDEIAASRKRALLRHKAPHTSAGANGANVPALKVAAKATTPSTTTTTTTNASPAASARGRRTTATTNTATTNQITGKQQTWNQSTNPSGPSPPVQLPTLPPSFRRRITTNSSNNYEDDVSTTSDDSDVLVLQGSGLNQRYVSTTTKPIPSHHSQPTRTKPSTATTIRTTQRHSMDSLASLGITSTSSTTDTSSSSSNSNSTGSPDFTPNNNIKAKNRTTTTNNKKPMVLDDTPESFTTKRKPPSRLNPFSKFALNHSALQDTSDDDDDDSRDEQMAIQLAIKNSLADATTTTTTIKKKKIIKKKQPQQRPLQQQQQTSHPKKKQPALPVVVPSIKPPKVTVLLDDNDDDDDDEPLVTEEFLNESSSEEENENDDEEVVVEEDSHEHKVATSVLETAASLSAQVLATMNQWARTTTTASASSSQPPPDGPEASHGLIVNDGALSLGTISTTSLPPNAQWISQDTMKLACPGVTLSKYQLIGVNWLALLHGMKCTLEQGSTSTSSRTGSDRGAKKDTPVNGVLADEMGLGKTVQTIAFLAWLKFQRCQQEKNQSASNYHPPHIIVVPVSVLPNWMREFELFAPHMKVIKYHGSMAEREQVQDEMQNYLPGRRHYPQGYLDVLLVPVTYYQKEKSDDRRFINKFQFDYLVVDEAHMLKNSLSTRYKMLNKVKTQHRLLLTGTPVQNSPQELLNMLCFIMPLFSKGSESLEYDDGDGDRNGTSSVVDRMLQHFVDTEQQKCGDEQVAYAKLKQLFAPFVLRRKKEDVIAQLLPPKKRVVEYVELDPAGRTIYNSILEDHINKNGTKVATVSVGEHLFTNLRKAAHHPLLLRTRHNTPSEVDHLVTYFHKYQAFAGEASTKAKVGEELAKYNDFEIHLTALDLVDQNPHRRPDLERYILDESALFSSAKFCRLRTLLPDLIHTQGHRVLIFSGWTSCLDLLGCLMEHLGLEYLRMDGSCPSDIRQARIDEFNTNPNIPVFLLSTRACGLGINLTAADTCIMHDLDFNPFNDLQAEDRCHRIGQTKPVTVYKFVSKDTVDADIYEMQERKAKMNAAIMESDTKHSTNGNSSTVLGKQERKAMIQSVVEKFLSPSGKGSTSLDRLEL